MRKLETTVHPDKYVDIFKESGNVIRVGHDFDVHDWKAATDLVMKKTAQWHFQFQPAKRCILTRGRKTLGNVQGEVAYSFNLDAPRTITKQGLCLKSIHLDTKPSSIPLNPQKK